MSLLERIFNRAKAYVKSHDGDQISSPKKLDIEVKSCEGDLSKEERHREWIRRGVTHIHNGIFYG